MVGPMDYGLGLVKQQACWIMGVGITYKRAQRQQQRAWKILHKQNISLPLVTVHIPPSSRTAHLPPQASVSLYPILLHSLLRPPFP